MSTNFSEILAITTSIFATVTLYGLEYTMICTPVRSYIYITTDGIERVLSNIHIGTYLTRLISALFPSSS